MSVSLAVSGSPTGRPPVVLETTGATLVLIFDNTRWVEEVTYDVAHLANLYTATRYDALRNQKFSYMRYIDVDAWDLPSMKAFVRDDRDHEWRNRCKKKQ